MFSIFYFPSLLPTVLCTNDTSFSVAIDVVTLAISRFAGPTQFFGDAHRRRVRMCVYRGESALMYVSVSLYLGLAKKVIGSRKKKNILHLLLHVILALFEIHHLYL